MEQPDVQDGPSPDNAGLGHEGNGAVELLPVLSVLPTEQVKARTSAVRRAQARARYANLGAREKKLKITNVVERRKSRRLAAASSSGALPPCTGNLGENLAESMTDPEASTEAALPVRLCSTVAASSNQQAGYIHKRSRRNRPEDVRTPLASVNEGNSTSSSSACPQTADEVGFLLSKLHKLRPSQACQHCKAFRIQYESLGFCCAQGQIHLATPIVPDVLHTLFTSTASDTEDFRKRLRAYNSIFSFTSFYANIDYDLASGKKGIFTFRAQGQVYHTLPSPQPSVDGPRYFQLYFYDTANETRNRMKIINDKPLDQTIVETLLGVMAVNPYATFLKSLSNANLADHVIWIRSDVELDQRVYNAPTADQVAAVWVEGNKPTDATERDIMVHANSGKSHRILHYYGCYDALQYPLFFPVGEIGWHRNILKKLSNQQQEDEPCMGSRTGRQTLTSSDDIFANEHDGTCGETAGKVSCREYYSYKLQDRPNVHSTLLYGRRLLQQFIVDMYIKVEATRLAFFRTQQTRIRADLYQGIVDSVVSGETRGSHVGKRIVLPASFVGGPRDMRKRYLDAIALVAKYGKPDFFITMTCNPEWAEIQACLKPGQTSQDRPDVVARIFRAKLHDLKQQLFKKKIFNDVAAHVHVIEFQKRGLPHAHMLLIMKAGHKILDPDEFDRFVSAEIPDPITYPELHKKVLKHMIHGPCGEKNPKNPCMQNNECRNYYPRQFAEETTQGKDSYPIYRRRNDGREVVVRNTLLDNRWVVPYNPFLLSRYDCHINVEICSGIKAVKYLYKYIYKGHDKVEVQIHPNDGTIVIDEIQQYQDARWVAAPEAIWRIYGFNLNEISPAVINLQLHLPNKQSVSYWETQDLTKLLKSHYSSQTMLTEFFTYCLNDKDNSRTYMRTSPRPTSGNRLIDAGVNVSTNRSLAGSIRQALQKENGIFLDYY